MPGCRKCGIVIEPGVTNLKLINNKISGHPEKDILDNSKNQEPTADSAY